MTHREPTLRPFERPRERLLELGPDALSDVELIAVVLGTGARGRGVLATARELVAAFPSLRRMASAGRAELATVPGVGAAQAARLKAALALATRLGGQTPERPASFGGPEDVHARLAPRLAVLEHEVLLALALDVKHRVIAERRLAQGGVCSVEVLPRDVFAPIVREAAAGVIFVHNHPSGDPAPSAADRALTDRLRLAGELVGVALVDHVIVTPEQWFSFADGRTGAPGPRTPPPGPRGPPGPARPAPITGHSGAGG